MVKKILFFRIRLTIFVMMLCLSARILPVDAQGVQPASIISTRVICSQPGRYVGWPTIAMTAEKDLLVVFSGDRDAHVCPWGKTQMIRSSDQGATWSDPVTINNSPLDDRDAGIMRTDAGTMIASWFTSVYFIYAFEDEDARWPAEMRDGWARHIGKISAETREDWLGNWIRRSGDSGLTWGERINTFVNSPHGPIQLSDGRLLYVGMNKIVGDRKGQNPPDSMRIAAVESIDDGLTWKIIGYIPVPKYLDPGAKAFHEAHAVETAEGKIIAMLRHHGEPGKHYLWQSESSDGGSSWTMAHQTKIWGYPPHLIRLKNDWLVVSYGYRREPFGNRACISRDDGSTWDVKNQVILSIAPNYDLGYPASVQLEDGTIYTVYYQAPADGELTRLMGTHWRIDRY